MLNKKLIFALLVFSLTISCVSADENISDVNETGTLDSLIKPTFTDLNNTINSNDNTIIYLDNDYTYHESDSVFVDGVPITRDLTIYGNDHTLNGNYLARIFIISPGYSVVFNDINFINGKSSGHGGAVYGTCNAINCNFTNNTAVGHGGAIYESNAENCNFIHNYVLNGNGGAMCEGFAQNCTFISNSAINGGALFKSSAVNCKFSENYAKSSGGAIYIGKYVENCEFNKNSAKLGGAVYETTIVNSKFNDNFATVNGGAMYEGYCENCIFTKNSAQENGGAMYGGSAKNCQFISNYAVNHGGAMYKSTGTYCTFKDNSGKTNDGYMCTLKKRSTKLYLSPASTLYYGQTMVMTLKDNNNKAISGVKVNVYVNGKLLATKITNNYGQIKVPSTYFGLLKYNIKITFNGDANYYKSTKSSKISVKKSSPVIYAKQSTFKKADQTKLYKITLKTKQNVLMKNTKVCLKINGKSYYAKTNSNGIATFKLAKLTKKGKYTAKISYSGNKYYNKAYKTTKITVK